MLINPIPWGLMNHFLSEQGLTFYWSILHTITKLKYNRKEELEFTGVESHVVPGSLISKNINIIRRNITYCSLQHYR